MDDELFGQRHDVSGERDATCDLCGMPTSDLTVVVLERHSPSDPEMERRVCASCRRQMEADELPIGSEDGLELVPDEV